MAYNWPDGWNDTRTEKAVHQWVCDTLDVPRYACRVTIDSPEIHGTSLEIFRPLTGKPTADVHEVLARVAQFAPEDDVLSVGRPLEKLTEHKYRLQYLFVAIK